MYTEYDLIGKMLIRLYFSLFTNLKVKKHKEVLMYKLTPYNKRQGQR